jgi:predicted ATPase/class 3 adenylate cyclase/DNA-binding CsgD family transcriptional regulator
MTKEPTAGLPTGTVTFLFTDIEGSTALLQRLGDRRYAEVLLELRRLLRQAFAEGHGQEVDAQGDAFMVAFSRANDAVTTAVAAQRALVAHAWPAGAAPRVRMGLHTGEPLRGETGYVGLDVHQAARIAAAAHGGQILLSDVTRGLAVKNLPPGVSVRDLGEHRLKDLARHPAHLFQVMTPGLPRDFAPLKTLDALPNNLPRQLTSFVGRQREMAKVKQFLTTASLVTLIGTGGAGKTRLALQVAADILDQYPDGIWLVECAPVSDAALVAQTVAAALGVPEQPSRALTDTLVDYLRSKFMLLLLDNCEHLREACARLVDALLRECPRLRILSTSREPLGVRGEIVWRVPSLALPDLQHLPSPEHLTQYESIRLFADRAASNMPEFQLTKANARAVAEICHRLDGIALAIELAAARVRTLSAEQIAARLDDRFRLLAGTSPTVLPRHRTLRAAIDWSHQLLTEGERTVLRRLSVFAGGCTLEGAESVCSEGGVQRAEVFDLVAQLVDKSLLIAETQARESRYRLLETVRQYGWERLHEAGEADLMRRRHRDWYLALAEQAAGGLDGSDQKAWLERLETELDNLRAALEWCRWTDEGAGPGLRLAIALRRFWENRAYFAEGRAWLDGLIAARGVVPPALRARALNCAGILAYRQGDYERVWALCSEALSICEQHPDAYAAGEALHFLAHVRQARGDYVSATEMMARSVTLRQEAGHRRGVANSLDCLGELARMQGDYDRANDLTQRARVLYADIGDGRGMAHTFHNLAYIRLHQGRRGEAQGLFRQSLIEARDLNSPRDIIMAVAGIAAAWVDGVPLERIARFLGAVDSLLGTTGVHLEPAEQKDFEQTVAALRARMEDDAFAGAWSRGREMTLSEAAEHALALSAAPSELHGQEAPRSDAAQASLTPREREVAALIAKGSTNREVAASLVISERTAEGHVQSILNKLGFRSRAQIAAWAATHGVAGGDEAR